MSEEDLEVLITLDDPEDLEKEDTFHDPKADNNIVPGQPNHVGDQISDKK